MDPEPRKKKNDYEDDAAWARLDATTNSAKVRGVGGPAFLASLRDAGNPLRLTGGIVASSSTPG